MANVTVPPVVEAAPGVHVLTRVPDKGFEWNVVTVALPGGGTLVYSPSWLDDRTLERVGELGTPKVFVAPNNSHHLTLERFRERWPDAIAVASPGALPRLLTKGHPGMKALSEAEALLPKGAAFHACEGTKSGEVWLSVPHAKGKTLIVCDSFFNITRPASGPVGWLMRKLDVLPGLKVSGLFKFFSLKDVTQYRPWALREIAAIAPTELVVCHGEALHAPDCTKQLLAAVTERWPE